MPGGFEVGKGDAKKARGGACARGPQHTTAPCMRHCDAHCLHCDNPSMNGTRASGGSVTTEGVGIRRELTAAHLVLRTARTIFRDFYILLG
jgi:hypothetical protein